MFTGQLKEGRGAAVISDCGRYRYGLRRDIGDGDRSILFIMANPSTADANEDDPTIRRCIGFARSLGFDRLYVGNLNPFRATDPRDVTMPPAEILDTNERWILKMRNVSCEVVCAWGANPDPDLLDRAWTWIGHKPKALALTKHGQPRHPLYLRKDLEPVDFFYPL